MLKVTTCVFCVLLLINYTAYTQEHLSKEAEKSLKAAIGYDLKGYKIYSYPTNNFGIGTACYRAWEPKRQILCDMVKCYGLLNVPTNHPAWRNVNGYAFVGSDGGAITLNDTVNKIFGMTMLLPKLLQVLNINLGIASNSTRSVVVTIDSALKRFLIYDSLVGYVQSLPSTSQMRKAFERNRLVLVPSDFVLLKYRVDISPEDSFGIKLAAKLDSALTINKTLTLDKDSLAFQVSKMENGRYSIVSSKPVVFAVSVQKQRSVQVNSANKGFEGWEAVEIKENDEDPTIARRQSVR